MLGEASVVYGSPIIKVTQRGQLHKQNSFATNGTIALSISIPPRSDLPFRVWVVMAEDGDGEIGKAIVAVGIEEHRVEYEGKRLN